LSSEHLVVLGIKRCLNNLCLYVSERQTIHEKHNFNESSLMHFSFFHFFFVSLSYQELEVKLDNLNDEYIKLESLKEKFEDELKEKQRTIESQELVSIK